MYPFTLDAYIDSNIEKRAYVAPMTINKKEFSIALPINRQTLDSILLNLQETNKYLETLEISTKRGVTKLTELSDMLSKEYGIQMGNDISQLLKRIVIEKIENDKPPEKINIVLNDKKENNFIKRIYTAEFSKDYDGYVIKIKSRIAEINNIENKIKSGIYFIPKEKVGEYFILARAEDYYPIFILLNIIGIYNPIMNGDVTEMIRFKINIKNLLHKLKRELGISILPIIDLRSIEDNLPSYFVKKYFREDNSANRYRAIQISIPLSIYHRLDNISLNLESDFSKLSRDIIKNIV